jgi:tetratricopeptide (TPR) repeat protein
MVFIRNGAWSNRLSLYESDSSTTKSAKVHALLGQELQYQINQSWNDVQSENQELIYSQVIRAKQAYENAIHTFPNYYKIKSNLATIESSFLCNERASSALLYELTKQQPDYQEAWENLLVSQVKTYIVWKRNEGFLTDKSLKNTVIYTFDSLSSLSVLGLLSQFEERGKLFLADGLNPTSIAQLSAFASGQATWNKTLAELNPSYAKQVNQRLMELYTGKKASYNIVDDFRKNAVGHFVAPDRFVTISDSLIDEIIATKAAIEQKFPKSKVEELTDTYLINALRYEAIIAIHKHQIKTGKGKAKDFVQIGNSYLNLGEKEKAIRAFNRAISSLRKMNNQAANEEIVRIESYIQKINNQ